MSIIHDALKKIQQEQALRAKGRPTDPATSNPSSPGPLFSTPAKTEIQNDQSPIEHLPSSPQKARSILALLCAIAITIGAFGFFFKQILTYFPQVKSSTISLYYKLIHKKEDLDLKSKAPEDLVPLAKINVIPAKPPTPPSPTNTANSATTALPTATPTMATTTKPNEPKTLNVHGVMSNGSNNLVLINDQVYQEGDEVDGIKIVKINLKSITVNNNGKEEEIKVKN